MGSKFAEFSEAFHIVHGDSAGGSLKVALRLKRDQLLVNEDPITCGPAPATHDLSEWRSTREHFIRGMYSERPELSFDEYADNRLLTNAERLNQGSAIVVWVARGLAEQLLLAWVVFLFDRFESDHSKLRVVHFENLRPRQHIIGIGELSPEAIREYCPEPRCLDPEEIMELRRVWHVYTSSDPAHLANYVASPSPMPSVHRAVSHLVYRYPDAKSGLSVWDEQLLRQTREHGPKAARVIGHTFCFDDTLDLVGDVYLFSRLIGMSGTDLVSPLISVTGDPTAMRRCEVKLTPFGEQVLAGEANHVKVSGIDDWIGGVHLSRERPVTFRDGDTLVLPG